MRQHHVSVKRLALLLFTIVTALIGSNCSGGGGDTGDASTADVTTNPCGPGTAIQCNGTCVDVNSDFQNCGSCGNACPSDQVCSHGSCATVCGGGSVRCGNNCLDLTSDPNNCGSCGNKCAGGQVCSKSTCALTCQSGLTDCTGACVDLTSNDLNCNACGNACADGTQCVASTCQATCQAGWSSCEVGDSGTTTCIDTTDDPNNCGGCNVKCQNGYFCSPPGDGGPPGCGLNCAGGTTLCNNACVDETIDPNHCGGCNVACGGGFGCSNSQCCPTNKPIYCGGCDTFANCALKGGGKITAGPYFTCAINPAGAVYCWGENSTYGVLGNNTTGNATTASATSTLTSGTASIQAGYDHVCALNSSGKAYCWGNGSQGDLGNSTSTYSLVPSAVTGINTTGLRVGMSEYASCFVLSSGAVNCAGWEYYNELPTGTASYTNSIINAPTATLITSGAVVVSGGIGEAQCAILNSGAVECWGDAGYGLGDGLTTFTSTPVTVSGITNAASVATSFEHQCVVTQAGQLKCWGYNGYGQLGNGSTTPSSSTTPLTSTLSGVVSACVGYYHTCVVTTSGAVQCVGYDYYGQLGNGSTTSTATWQTPIASGAVSVACGNYHTCALMANGKAECWGYNYYGEAGNGTTTTVTPYGLTSPVVVSGF